MKKTLLSFSIAILGIASVTTAQIDSLGYQSGVDSSTVFKDDSLTNNLLPDSSLVDQSNISDSLLGNSNVNTFDSTGGNQSNINDSLLGDANVNIFDSTGGNQSNINDSLLGDANVNIFDSTGSNQSNINDSLFVNIDSVDSALVLNPQLYIDSLGLMIIWEKVTNALTYCIQIGEDSSFQNLLVSDCGLQNQDYELHWATSSNTDSAQHRSASVNQYFYRVGATDANNITNWSAARTFTSAAQQTITGVKSHELATALSVYPNPTAEVLYVSATSAASVNLFDVQGNTVLVADGEHAAKGIDVSNVKTGVYILQVSQGTTVTTFKINKQ
jgi:hypothetical protein